MLLQTIVTKLLQPETLLRLGLIFLVTLLVLYVVNILFWQPRSAPKPRGYQPVQCGDITLDTLAKYDGSDSILPIYFAVRGKVYDVTPGASFYGPGGDYAVFAGKEVSRALALMSVDAKDCSGDMEGLTQRQLDTLQEWEDSFGGKYSIAGQVVPPKQLTLEELMAFDGSDPAKPIYLAISGVIFDVTQGKEYYGPDGMYPFAGRECARAFAMLSTDTDDCKADLEGLGAMELQYLRDWEDKFNYKYPVVGSVVSSKLH